eukprot:1617194-Alexandrium_andersonii.AAC.1
MCIRDRCVSAWCALSRARASARVARACVCVVLFFLSLSLSFFFGSTQSACCLAGARGPSVRAVELAGAGSTGATHPSPVPTLPTSSF